MADMSKAERLAAARRKLQDYQKNKSKPHDTTLERMSFSPGLSTEQSIDVTEGPLQQIKHSPAVDLLVEPTKPISPQIFDIATNNALQNHQEFPLEPNPPAVNGLQSHLTPQKEELTHSHQLFDPPVCGEPPNPHFISSPQVFSASSFFDTVSGVSSNHVNEDSLSHFHPESQNKTSFNTASHLFPSSSFENQNFNIDHNKFPVLDSFSNAPALDVHSLSENVVFPQVEECPASNKAIHPPPPPVPERNVSESLNRGVAPGYTSDASYSESNSENKPQETLTAYGRSSSESLRQLSDQMSQLLQAVPDPVDFQVSSTHSFLELRNQELAAQLAFEQKQNQQLQFSLKESQSLVSHLEAKLLDHQSQQETVLARHLGPLHEQLRAHAQTVGILVGEKTELEAALAHHTASAKQHLSEVEELQNRLRASRHRVSELEKELATVCLTATTADQQRNDHAQELDQLHLQNSMLSKQLEDAEEEASELRQKLSSRVSEVAALEHQLQEKQSQLSLAQLRVTQLSSSDSPEASAEIESLHQLKISLEKRCTELLETVQQLTIERDQADQQYQQYVAQLNGQLQTVCSKLETTNVENEKLKCREEDLVRNISELERQLQQLQHFQNQQLAETKAVAVCSEDHSGVFERVSQLEEDRQNLKNSLDLQTQEMSRLKSDLEERGVHIAELEALCSERPDQSLLLAAMESDKVAAAQATSQNTLLKQQLQELQDGFIKMSNDKLHLTEHLEHEKHVNKEMGEKISQLAEELHELRVLVSEKEQRIQQMEHNHDHSHENCGDFNHNHTDDHTRHVDAHHEFTQDVDSKNRIINGHDGHNTSPKPEETAVLQEQLIQAKDHIHNLSSQNNSLRRLLTQKSTESHESGSSSSATEGATTDDATADIDTNFEDVQGKSSSYLSKQYAMEKLQERFTRLMGEVAELSDEKQRLEHLVLQLQSETETIGEYVTLYQLQRSALQQRAKEKDHQLACLSAEREDLRCKLNALNTLVHRLVEESGSETASEALPALSSYISNSDSVHLPNDAIKEQSVSADQSIHTDNLSAESVPSTAGKILALLTEIGSSSLVDTSASEGFHPCPWCSGRLITV